MYPISAFVTHLVYLRDGAVQVDTEHITVRQPIHYITLSYIFRSCKEIGCQVLSNHKYQRAHDQLYCRASRTSDQRNLGRSLNADEVPTWKMSLMTKAD